LGYFFVHANRHSPASHLITPYLCHSITNPNIHLKLCRSMASRCIEFRNPTTREHRSRRQKMCARGALGILPQVEDNDWVWWGYVAICCDWFGMIKWSVAWRTLKCDSCSCRSLTQFTISNQHLSS
jgi:hypothetical protein